MYKIILQKSAEKFIRKQPKNIQQRIYDAIKQLPYGTDIRKLSGYRNRFRRRTGDFRIIYDKYDDVFIIDVVEIDNQGQVYKHL